MRHHVLRALAVLTAICGLALVVAHAGLTSGCSPGEARGVQAPSNASDSTAPTAADPAPTKPAGGGSPKAKRARDMRYLPATKAAPVFMPRDVEEDEPPAQSPAPQQARKGGR